MKQYGIVVVLYVVLATSFAQDLEMGFKNALDVGVYDMVSSRSGNCGNIKHPFGCTFSPDCSVKTCKINFAGLEFVFQIKINKCDSPVTVTVSAQVPKMNINFGHTFPTDQILPIPGLGQGIGPLQGGVFILVKLKSDSSNLNVMIQLQCGIALGNAPIFPIKLDLIKGRLPIDTSTCGNVGGGGGGGGLPPPPPAECRDVNPLCGFLASQCSNQAISGTCQKTCKHC